MQVKGCFDKRVLDKILAMAGKSPLIYPKLLEFVKSCHEIKTYDGMWSKGKKSNDFFRLLGSSGKRFGKIDASVDFTDILKDTDHFTLSITTDDSRHFKSLTPVLSLTRLQTLIEEVTQTAFYIKKKDEFINASLIHEPTSVLINDRYFFNDENPGETLIILLKNIIPIVHVGCVVVTIFCSLPGESTSTSSDKHAVDEFQDFSDTQTFVLEKTLSSVFPDTRFIIEIFQTRKHNITHDRFLFTDFLCYKSEKSFQFLPNNESGIINRFPIYEGSNFKANIEYLTDFLTNANQRTLQCSLNPIIKSFLGKKDAVKTV